MQKFFGFYLLFLIVVALFVFTRKHKPIFMRYTELFWLNESRSSLLVFTYEIEWISGINSFATFIALIWPRNANFVDDVVEKK